MISDEELLAFTTVDTMEYAKKYFQIMQIPDSEIEDAMGPMGRSQEMARELLQLREEKRKADMQHDGAWISGAKFGWNCGIANDQDQFSRCIESARALIVEERKAFPKRENRP